MRARLVAAVGLFVALPLMTVLMTVTGAFAMSLDDESDGAPGTDGEGTVTGAVKKLPKLLADKMKEAPPKGAGEQLSDYARTASRHLRPLRLPLAIGFTIAGFVLLLFGRKLFRISIPLYMMAFVGFIGHTVGGHLGGEGSPLGYQLAGALIGCLVGAGIAIPLRAVVRFLIGALAGGILAFVVAQAVTSSTAIVVLAAAAGVIVSGFLTFVYPAPLLVIGFSIFGAALASVGILSVATEAALDPAGIPHLVYRPAHVAGVILAAILGGIFQSQFQITDEEEG